MLAATAGHLAECPDLGPECRSPTPPVPYNHHIDLFMSETALEASYGLTPLVALEARLSLRVTGITPTYSELDGAPKLVPNDIHHHAVTLVGPGDPWLSVRAFARAGKLTTTARLGFSLPLGRTEPDPYALAAEGKWHEHMQFGTGTFMPLVGAGASYNFNPVEISGSALGLFSLAENSHGYRAPSRYFVSTRGALSLLDGDLRPNVSLGLVHETEELWQGRAGLEGTTVRTDILAGAGVAFRFADPWTVELGVRARLAQLTNAASFDYPGILELSLSTQFDTLNATNATNATNAGADPD
jgi:hypothetical protein